MFRLVSGKRGPFAGDDEGENDAMETQDSGAGAGDRAELPSKMDVDAGAGEESDEEVAASGRPAHRRRMAVLDDSDDE